MIDVKGMTLKYPSGKGVFNLTFSVKEGEVMGYLGPNGAGKTTTIRALMGFMQPNSGICTINGLDCYSNAAVIKQNLGYIPGEISFPSGMNCLEFLKYQCTLRGVKDYTLMNSLIERFELDTKGKIKRFSKGMKQKVGIITAFMHDPEILILDEPTSGLDPLMQNAFIDLVLFEKKKGKTILMSSHMFEEVERTCDNVLIIKDGIVKAQSDVVALKSTKRKGYIVHTTQIDELKAMGYETHELSDGSCEVYVKGEEIDSLIKKLSKIKINRFDSKAQNLEEIFLGYYGTEGK
jgi:ABC-2 type transport system ATP-binding protein